MKDSIGRATMRVTTRDLSTSLKTGTVKVLSTSILEALMEQASCNALEVACFISGQTSVAHSMKLSHLRPSPIGATITAISKVSDIDRDGICFEIEASDEMGLVGKAVHKRVFVNKDQYERKAYDAALSAKSL